MNFKSIRAVTIIATAVLLTSCIGTPPTTVSTDNAKDGELGNDSYIPYQYVHTNPPDKLLPPPSLIYSKKGEYTYYNENELEAFADALVEYHSYLERYIGSMEGRDGKTLVDVGTERCEVELDSITLEVSVPKRPIAPNYSDVATAEGTTLAVRYLNDVDNWIETLESHHTTTVKDIKIRLRKLKSVCIKRQ